MLKPYVRDKANIEHHPGEGSEIDPETVYVQAVGAGLVVSVRLLRTYFRNNGSKTTIFSSKVKHGSGSP